jgi:hypothetical protein
MPTTLKSITKLPVSMETLETDAQEQMKRFAAQQERLNLFKSDLDLLMQRYQLKKSFFTKASLWYADKNWIEKTQIGLVVVSLALGLGICVHALAFIAVSSAYLGLIFLFNNYNNEEGKRVETLCSNIVVLEKELLDSVESFNEIESKLITGFKAMQEQNELLEVHVKMLAEQALLIQQQSLLLQNSVKQLQGQEEALSSNTTLIQDSGNKLSLGLDGLNNRVSDYSQMLSQLTTEVDATVIQGNVNQCQEYLAQIHEQITINNRELEKQLAHCDTLDANIDYSKKLLDEDRESRRKIFSDTLNSHERARRLLESFKECKNNFVAEETKNDLKITLRTSVSL